MRKVDYSPNIFLQALINVEPPSLPHANQKNAGTPDDPQKQSDEKSCEKASANVEETPPSSASQGKNAYLLLQSYLDITVMSAPCMIDAWFYFYYL